MGSLDSMLMLLPVDKSLAAYLEVRLDPGLNLGHPKCKEAMSIVNRLLT